MWQQCGEGMVNFVLHADGKYKLHHGKWIVFTIGTHDLNWNTDRNVRILTHIRAYAAHNLHTMEYAHACAHNAA